MKYELQYLALVILLPLIPAYLLYRTMPSGAWAKGPFKGLKIHLTGAFAGYFILLVTIVSLAFGLMKPLRDEIEELKIRNRYQSWTIEVKKTGLGRNWRQPAQQSHSSCCTASTVASLRRRDGPIGQFRGSTKPVERPVGISHPDPHLPTLGRE